MVDKFYHPKIHETGWHKNMAMAERRKLILKAHKNNYLSSARAMQALANVTQDIGTRKAARADAIYFFSMYDSHR